MNNLVQRIVGLPDEQALEALNLLSGDVLGDSPEEELIARLVSVDSVGEEDARGALAAATPMQMAALSRLALVVHAVTDSADEVAAAIAETGRKAFVLELAVIGMLGLSMLHLLATRGKKSERRTSKVTVKPDGTVELTIDDEVTYFSVGESLAPLVGALLKPLRGDALG